MLILKKIPPFISILIISCLFITYSAPTVLKKELKPPVKPLSSQNNYRLYLILIAVLLVLVLIAVIAYMLNKASKKNSNSVVKTKSASMAASPQSSIGPGTSSQDTNDRELAARGVAHQSERQKQRDAIINRYKNKITRCTQQLKTLKGNQIAVFEKYTKMDEDRINYALPVFKSIAFPRTLPTCSERDAIELQILEKYNAILLCQKTAARNSESAANVQSELQPSELQSRQLNAHKQALATIFAFRDLLQAQIALTCALKLAHMNTNTDMYMAHEYRAVNELQQARSLRFQPYFEFCSAINQCMQACQLLAQKVQELNNMPQHRDKEIAALKLMPH